MVGVPCRTATETGLSPSVVQVRLAGLVSFVDFGGPELTRTETVTILNDLCVYPLLRMADPLMKRRIAVFVNPNAPHRPCGTPGLRHVPRTNQCVFWRGDQK